MGNSHDNQINRFIAMAMKELDRDIKEKLGHAIIEEYLEQFRKELIPMIEEMVNDVNIKEFGIVKNLMEMREDLNIIVKVEDKRG
jgi:hypothetical protein